MTDYSKSKTFISSVSYGNESCRITHSEPVMRCGACRAMVSILYWNMISDQKLCQGCREMWEDDPGWIELTVLVREATDA